MLCERCHAHPATVHMVQVVNGHRKEEHLCSECAEKEHVFQKEQSFFGHGFLTVRWIISSAARCLVIS